MPMTFTLLCLAILFTQWIPGALCVGAVYAWLWLREQRGKPASSGDE